MARPGVGLVLIAALTACDRGNGDTSAADAPEVESASARATKLQPEVKAQLARVTAAGKKVQTEPPVQREQPFAKKLAPGAFVIVGDKWLANLDHAAAANELSLMPALISLCITARKAKMRETKDDDVASYTKYMQECLDWRYVAVVRPRQLSLPRVDAARKTFAPGSFQGDMLLVALKSGAIEGRYPLNITNSDNISGFEELSPEEWHDAAKRDLEKNVNGVIAERLEHKRDAL